MALSIAMIMVNNDLPLTLTDILRDLSTHWPDISVEAIAEQPDGMLSFYIDAAMVIVAKISVPIPWSNLEGPCATSMLWPQATEEVKQHKAHWIATVSGDLTPLELSTVLTQAVAAILTSCPSAIGVYWGSATLLVPKGIFIEFAREILPISWPLYIWVDFRVFDNGDNTCSGFTTGMRALGHMEFEAENVPGHSAQLRHKLMPLAQYVVENGPVIKDSHTVGDTVHERVRVIYSPSVFGHREKVMRLDFGTIAPKTPPPKLH